MARERVRRDRGNSQILRSELKIFLAARGDLSIMWGAASVAPPGGIKPHQAVREREREREKEREERERERERRGGAD